MNVWSRNHGYSTNNKIRSKFRAGGRTRLGLGSVVGCTPETTRAYLINYNSSTWIHWNFISSPLVEAEHDTVDINL
jgi:hypothetical protein